MSASVLDTPHRPSPATGVRTVRVALAGCGVVGGELVRRLREGEAEIAARYGVRFELARVLVRGSGRSRPDELPPGVLTTDLEAFLSTPSDMVVEAIGGLDPALRIALGALHAGRRFVTANKALVAAYGPELMRVAREERGRLDFESAVAGGIPVLRALRDQLMMTEIRSVRGILNGTTNFVLSRMAEGRSYAEALSEAQALGFAEADPARDVSGEDAADKLRILAWLAFGVDPRGFPLRRRGLVPHPDRLAADAAALGGVPRLLAEASRGEYGVTAAVEPVIVRPDSELGQVRGEENVVVIESRWNGTLRLVGPGVGGAPTASALLSDMVRSAHPAGIALEDVASGVAEVAPHRWLLSVVRAPHAEGILARSLERTGAPVLERLDGPGVLRALLAPVPWPRIDLVLRVLSVGGLAPVVSRVEP